MRAYTLRSATMFLNWFYIVLGLALGIGMMSDFSYGAACREDERNYLLDFKGGLNDSYGRLSSWHGFNCCEWQGIACDYHTNHVIQLDLKNSFHKRYDSDRDYQVSYQLSGQIHPSLFNLQHLRHLDLSWNDFEGVNIPPQLGTLKSLTFLSLAFTKFQGEIPLELGNLSALRHLDLSHYYYYFAENDPWRLKSSRFDEWVRKLRNLEYLGMKNVNLEKASPNWGESLSILSNLGDIYLSVCGLSGSIPSLVNLTRLSHLHLRHNSFPYPLPDWFQNVSSLVSLDLGDCGVNGSIPSNFLQASSSLSNLLLFSNNLQGIIPPCIANFSEIQKLCLDGNYLIGDIPSFGSPLAPLSSLSSLDLSGNFLTGRIPNRLGRLSSLQNLILDNNQLNGDIPTALSQLTFLRRLKLDNNRLSGKIPNSFSQLVRLEVLSLSSNSLTGDVSIVMFENLIQLRILLLSRNQLTVSIPLSWVPKFSSLQYLGLSSCHIEGNFPMFPSTQYLLQDLDLSDNRICGNVPTWLGDLANLIMLNLSNNQLQGFLPPLEYNRFYIMDLHNNSFHGPISVISFKGYALDLSDNKFNGSIPATILPRFTLSLSRNNLSGGIPFSMCKAETRLVILDLSENRLKDVISADLGRCSHLVVLNLAKNDIHGELPEELGNFTQLQTFNLNGNNLEGPIPPSIANCTDIKVFDIGNNRFQGSIPVWIGRMACLQILSLTNNKLGGSIPPQLFELQNLQIMDLSHNNISGAIPKSLNMLHAMVNQSQSFETKFFSETIGEWTDAHTYIYNNILFVDQITLWIKGTARPYPKIWRAFKVMDLSQNNLQGSIPQEMGLLQGLVALNISSNNISGSIPQCLGQMFHLESLDLSENMLSGKIPQELVSLTFISVLNLSDNMLSRLIPQENQFSNFDSSSFQGNPNLTGPPLERIHSSNSSEKGSGLEVNSSTAVGNTNKMDQWWAVSVGISYGLGFAAVIAVLCFHIERRYRCFAWMDGIVAYICDR